MILVLNETFDFFVKMDEFHFASSAPNSIGFGLNLMIY